MVHGLLSFGIAYALFFASIGGIGPVRTALITAFWPMLALGIGYVRAAIADGSVDEEIAFRHLFLAPQFSCRAAPCGDLLTGSLAPRRPPPAQLADPAEALYEHATRF